MSKVNDDRGKKSKTSLLVMKMQRARESYASTGSLLVRDMVD